MYYSAHKCVPVATSETLKHLVTCTVYCTDWYPSWASGNHTRLSIRVLRSPLLSCFDLPAPSPALSPLPAPPPRPPSPPRRHTPQCTAHSTTVDKYTKHREGAKCGTQQQRQFHFEIIISSHIYLCFQYINRGHLQPVRMDFLSLYICDCMLLYYGFDSVVYGME